MIVREGARKMLQSALEKEVDDFLGRHRYQRTEEQRGYRNGHLPKRSIGVGMGAVEVSLPRVSDVPKEVSQSGFQSEIVTSYQRRSRTQARLMVRLYLEGLSSGDFEPVFRALVGETAALSASSIVRLKEEWQQEYETWRKRPLRGRYVYLFADGLYLKAGSEKDKTAVLVVLGVDEQGSQLVQLLARLRPQPLWQLVEHIQGSMVPASLMAGGWEHLVQRRPQPQRAVTDRQQRRILDAALLE